MKVGEVVNDAMKRMNLLVNIIRESTATIVNIETTSEQILIIKDTLLNTLKEIAKTNLLALNAAIEVA